MSDKEKPKLTPEEIVRRAKTFDPFLIEGQSEEMSYRFVSKDPTKLAEAELKGWEIVSTADPKHKNLQHLSFKTAFGKRDGGDTTIQTAHNVLCARPKEITEAFVRDQERRVEGRDKAIRELQERMKKYVKDRDGKRAREALEELRYLTQER